MEVVRPGFLPDPDRTREEMEALQRDIAAAASFDDGFGFDVAALELAESPTDAPTAPESVGEQVTLADGDAPVVVGVDQAFVGDDYSVSAAVAIRDGRVVERAAGRAALELPYIPGLLAFREGDAIVDALESLSVEPDVLVLDGSGRIHFRQAGIATHVGVLFDVPAVGVAKNLLCGRPRESLDDPLPEGARVAIEADDSMDAPDGTVVGYAYQSRQYPNPEQRHVNPLVVSPGHRVSAETAVDVVEATCTGYKLPAPTRLADQYADDLKGD
ncbi:endonuclease V [Halobacterium sp. CBA1126]|uniref:endonuclease V n=1 Tax=Halobacterium sp. CBA1126 TaxID=2668074 RepID=UPI0012F9B2DE|nr:endonuclease V [Halobacterium sp. CBA1126]MUV60460.1 endonuclease V [Halobacterium sp. CBA1126]